MAATPVICVVTAVFHSAVPMKMSTEDRASHEVQLQPHCRSIVTSAAVAVVTCSQKGTALRTASRTLESVVIDDPVGVTRE
jgi:hypothetical protein